MRYLLGFVLVLALGVTSCSEASDTASSGGTAGGAGGDGGVGGMGGAAGNSIERCQQTTERCANATIGPHVACCEQAVPDQSDACDGTESLQNPETCTPTGNTITHRLTLVELVGDCNVGYDLDACEGQSCVPTALTPAEGMSGVDNALAGLASILDDIGADLSTFNQALSGSLCGFAPGFACDGGDDDGEPCSLAADCRGADARCVRVECLAETQPAEIRFAVDANLSEGCANVTVLANGEAAAHILNLSEDGCASGTLGTIPISSHGTEVPLENTVVRMSVSSEGFSHGLLGAVMDVMSEDLLWILFGDTLVAEVPVSVLDISVSTPPTRDASAVCSGLSATFAIGGVAE